MRINIWVYKDRRTNPGRIHRILPVTKQFNPDGTEIPQPEQAVVVAEIVRESATDGHEAVNLQKLEAVHLGSFELEKPWGPNGEWLGPRGVLYIYEDEYPNDDPHELFVKFETIRSAGPAVVPGQDVQVVDASGAVVTAGVAPDGSVFNKTTGEVITAPTGAPPSGAPPLTDNTTRPADSDHLPDGFPGKAQLEAAGLKTFGKIRKQAAAGKLESIENIGPITAKAISDAVA